MDPNLDSEPKDQSDELPPSAKLQAGYVRYVRIKLEEGPDGEVHLKDMHSLVAIEAWPLRLSWFKSNTLHRNFIYLGRCEIFRRVDQVISWLGPAYDNSEHAMSVISAYSDEFPVEHQVISPTELSDAICSLCERAYWERVWVFQELRHARLIVLICGDQSLSWDRFKNLWRVIVDIAATSEDASERLRQSLATRMLTLRTKTLDFSL